MNILLDWIIAALTSVSRFCNFGLSVSGIGGHPTRYQFNAKFSMAALCTFKHFIESDAHSSIFHKDFTVERTGIAVNGWS